MSHTWRSHVTRLHESHHIYKTMQVSFRKTTSGCFAERDLQLKATWGMHESCHIYKTSAWTSHVTRMHESCHIYKTSSSQMWRDSYISLTWLIHGSNVTYSRSDVMALMSCKQSSYSSDASGCRSLSAKQPLIVLRKELQSICSHVPSNVRLKMASHRMPQVAGLFPQNSH